MNLVQQPRPEGWSEPWQPWIFEHPDGRPVGAGYFVDRDRAIGYAREQRWTIAKVLPLGPRDSERHDAGIAL